MKFLHILLFGLFFISCQKKDIKVPLNDNPGIHEIWNNSHVFVLIKKQKNDTLPDVKLGQIISTTDWLVAIDRRLRMSKLRSAIRKILKARHKKSIHKNGNEKAYLTYMDTVSGKISFVRFDSIRLMPSIYTSQTYFKKYYKEDSLYKKIHIFIYPDKIIILNKIFQEPIQKDQLTNYTQKIHQDSTKFYLNFDEKIYYDRFLNYYTFFKNFKKNELDNKIFIFEH